MRQWNDKYSLVRLLHAIPEGEDVDIYINDSPLYKDLDFTEFSQYIYIPEGKYEITVYLADTRENPIIKQDVSIDVNKLITIAMTGESNDLSLLLIEEETEFTTGNKSKVRVVHLSPNTQGVNILADNKLLFENVEFRDITTYKSVPPQVYTVDIESYPSKKLLRSNKVTINPNRIYTFYAVGNAPNVEIIQSLDGGTFTV